MMLLLLAAVDMALQQPIILAKECGITNVAVLEKGYIGGGNTGRNTTIIRSNYLRDEASSLYEHSMRLWEGLSEDLNFNVMFSQRGVYNLGHTLQDMRDIERRVNANVLNGVDAVVVDHKEIKEQIPIINTSKNARYPIMGASFQARAGVARHDGVAWGFARAASNLGVDIIQNCEVIDIEIEEGRVKGVKTTQGRNFGRPYWLCQCRPFFSTGKNGWILDCQLRVTLCKHLFLKQ